MSDIAFTTTPQQKIAADPAHSVWVTANAGSGKTHVLVERVVRLMLEGTEPSTILCVTYTKAAAAEMSARLFRRLGAWTALDDDALHSELRQAGLAHVDPAMLTTARRLFTRALETPGGLKIQTIHAFCERLLQLFPVEAGLAPGFSVLDERREVELREIAIVDVLQEAESIPDSQVGRAFATVVAHANTEQFDSLIREFLGATRGLRNLIGSNLDTAAFEIGLKSALRLDPDSTIATTAGDLAQIDASEYRHHADILAQFKIHGAHDIVAHMRDVIMSGDRVPVLRKLFLTDKQTSRKSLMAKATEASHPGTSEFLEKEQQRVFDLFTNHDLHIRIEATSALFSLAKAVLKKIETQKRRHGLYDFDDLISRTAILLSSSRAAQWVLYKLDAGLKHILLDEAQDTSPAQWLIVKSLADEFFAGAGIPGNIDRTLFVVGDRKQSIFSFQGADAAAFALARQSFEQQIKGSDKELKTIDLSISYRSTQEILTAVDTVFPPSSPARLGIALHDQREQPHQTNRMGAPGVVEIWPLYEDLERNKEEPWTAPVDREPAASPRRRLARDIAETIRTWIGTRVIAARGDVVKPGDIMILLQSRGPLFSMLIAELRRLHVPVAGADRLQLLNSLAVQDLLALLQWISLPQDDYSLACILKSPLLPDPLDEEKVLKLAHGRGTASLWSRLEVLADKNAATLSGWQKLAAQSGAFTFLAQVLSQRRKAMVARLGTEAEDATDAMLDQALAYEQDHGQSLAGFLQWFTGQDTNLKREMEKDTGEVRLMTVHGAKGLEANIVFLPDAASVPGGSHSMPKLLTVPLPDRAGGLPYWKLGGLTKASMQEEWENAEKLKVQAERNRLLYVAMTRACDELYICGFKGEKDLAPGCWYDTVMTALVGQEIFDVYHRGPEHVYRDRTAVAPTGAQKLPAWLIPAPHEAHTRSYGLTSLTNKTDATYNPVAAQRGTALHALLLELPEIALDRQEAYALRKAQRAGLSGQDVLKLLPLLNDPEMAVFFGPESRGEAELRGRLADGRMINGRVDRIVVLAEEILVLDYKTDLFVPAVLGAEHMYMQQMALYAELLQLAYPQHYVRAALLWTQVARFEWLSPAMLRTAHDLAVARLEPQTS